MQVLAEADVEQLHRMSASDEPFWLDLHDPDAEELGAVGRVLGLHELALEDTQEWGQRPKLDVYDDQLLLVFFGSEPSADGLPTPIEVHVHMARSWVLTVSRMPPAEFGRVRDHLQRRPVSSKGMLLYRVMDSLADSLLNDLEQTSREVDDYERGIFRHPGVADRNRMATLRRSLNSLRRTMMVQRPVFDRAAGHMVELTENGEDLRPYLRDVGDHLGQVLDDIDAQRETLQGMLDNYSNQVQERLTVVATIFLPLTALTGFFGMNFNWLINHLGAAWAFFGLGLGTMLLSSLVIVLWLRRSGLIGRPGEDDPAGEATT